MGGGIINRHIVTSRVRDFLLKSPRRKLVVAILHNLTRMKIKEKIAIYNILLVLKQYEFKVDIIIRVPIDANVNVTKNGNFNVNLDLNDYQRVQ